MFALVIIGIAGIILYSVLGGNVTPPDNTVLQPESGYIPPPANNPVTVTAQNVVSSPTPTTVSGSVSQGDIINYNINHENATLIPRTNPRSNPLA